MVKHLLTIAADRARARSVGRVGSYCSLAGWACGVDCARFRPAGFARGLGRIIWASPGGLVRVVRSVCSSCGWAWGRVHISGDCACLVGEDSRWAGGCCRFL